MYGFSRGVGKGLGRRRAALHDATATLDTPHHKEFSRHYTLPLPSGTTTLRVEARLPYIQPSHDRTEDEATGRLFGAVPVDTVVLVCSGFTLPSI